MNWRNAGPDQNQVSALSNVSPRQDADGGENKLEQGTLTEGEGSVQLTSLYWVV
jgi:hypothetical protein